MSKLDQNAVGERGENILYLRLTSLKGRKCPLFRPAFLGAKYPTLDFFVELVGKSKVREFFFIQVKTTQKRALIQTKFNIKKSSINPLLLYPAPTYLALVEEDTGEVFLKSVHKSPVRKTYYSDPQFLLNDASLARLRQEVQAYWRGKLIKPLNSTFHNDTTW